MSRPKRLRVCCPKKPDWGLGHVLADDGGAKVTVFFLAGGKLTLNTTITELDLVTGEAAKNPILDIAEHANWQNAHHNLYVVELRPAIFKKERRFFEANPHWLPGKLCVYVGITGLTPEAGTGSVHNAAKVAGILHLRWHPVLTWMRTSYLDLHFHPRPEPVDDRHESIDREAPKLRIADAREVSRRGPCALLCSAHAQALSIEHLDDFCGQDGLELFDVRVLVAHIAEHIPAPSHHIQFLGFHCHISFSLFRRSLIRSSSRWGVLMPRVDFF